MAFNPMHPGNSPSYDDVSPFAGGFARFGASASTAQDGGTFDGGTFDEVAAAQDRLLNEALAIGHAPAPSPFTLLATAHI